MSILHSKETLSTQLQHRSIREFTDQPVSAEIRAALLAAAASGSTSSFLQLTRIIRITDQHKRQRLRQLCANQAYVEQAPEFWVFVFDGARARNLVPEAEVDWLEVGLIGAIDTGIMAQNVMLAAESLGLGGVYIGALRNNIAEVADLLQLPPETLPLFGMCLGYPAQAPLLKPKLPPSLFVSENTYQAQDLNGVEEYEREVRQYYQNRGSDVATWQDAIEKTLCKPVRPHMLPFAHKQKLIKR